MRKTSGFSLIELLIVVAIILVIAAIAIPRMLQAKITANEASAVSGLRNITNAQVTYKIFYSVYADNLEELGPTKSDLVNPVLGKDPYQLNGYVFETSRTEDKGFEAHADPIEQGVTGYRHFCTTTPAVINFGPDDCDPETSPVLNQ